jgi:hypothetical protein
MYIEEPVGPIHDIVTCLLKVRIVEPEETAVSRERLGKHSRRTVGGGALRSPVNPITNPNPVSCH